MKMSDTFGYSGSRSVSGHQLSDAHRCEIDAAAHAVRNHDDLTQALSTAIDMIEFMIMLYGVGKLESTQQQISYMKEVLEKAKS